MGETFSFLQSFLASLQHVFNDNQLKMYYKVIDNKTNPLEQSISTIVPSPFMESAASRNVFTPGCASRMPDTNMTSTLFFVRNSFFSSFTSLMSSMTALFAAAFPLAKHWWAQTKSYKTTTTKTQTIASPMLNAALELVSPTLTIKNAGISLILQSRNNLLQ